MKKMIENDASSIWLPLFAPRPFAFTISGKEFEFWKKNYDVSLGFFKVRNVGLLFGEAHNDNFYMCGSYAWSDCSFAFKDKPW